ncbi:perlucin-like protein [Homarus americanus]|uniref:Collectin-12-like n=1 Tax=Homarus americanus TaxID=6706 RepID=A0A8J5TJV9_HOMAM|nr:perlucin-like protein [Homarus americanus]KAG7173523.1 collectin-12-like [Homarus americanus]
MQGMEMVLLLAVLGVTVTLGGPTSTFLMVERDLAPPYTHTTLMTPAECTLACFASGIPTCLGFVWLPLPTSTNGEDGCDSGQKSCNTESSGGIMTKGRCGLLQCVPNPFTLVSSPGARIYLVRGSSSPKYGSIKAPSSYTMACTYAYRVFNKVQLTFQGAEDRCTQDGAQLIAIKSEEEQRVVKESVQEGEAYWIGLSDRRQEGDWRLSDGSKPSYVNWDIGQPNNYVKSTKDQDCAMLFQGAWNDNQCDQELRFICQIPFLEI